MVYRSSGAEPTKEASIIEVDTSVDDEVVRFQRKINAITKTRRFVISKNNGKLFAFCNVCSVKMVAGKEHKGQDMFLITQHMATATHKTIVSRGEMVRKAGELQRVGLLFSILGWMVP